MGWSKGELVNAAFAEIGLANYIFEISPDQSQDAIKKLDSMVSGWTIKGIRLGYPPPATAGGSAASDDSQVPDWAVEAIVQNLALRLAAAMGRPVSMDLNKNAKVGYDALLARASHPPEMSMPPTLPSGAGIKPWRGPQRPYIDDPDLSIEIGPDSESNIGRNQG